VCQNNSVPTKPRADKIREWHERQGHRHGRWAGANNDPLYRRRRGGNPSGYLLLVGGGIAFGTSLAYALHGGSGWGLLQTIGALAAGVILVIAGTRLLRKKLPRD
jgi:hypothetical protein